MRLRKKPHVDLKEKMNYEEIFHQRGNLYDEAMRKWPMARMNEFHELFRANPLKPGDRILDLPSGGGYLKNYLFKDVTVDSWEISDGFLRPGVNAVAFENISKDIPHGYDHIVCLAALHHIEEKFSLFEQFADILKTGGILHLADVGEETGIKKFLDEFVDQHNPMGHRGSYLSINDALKFPGDLKLVRRELVSVPWSFQNQRDCAEFIRLLFGLDSTAKPNIIIEALKDFVGVKSFEGSVIVNWQLQYMDLRKE